MELQVFPDTGSDAEMMDAVGDGQVGVNVSRGVGVLVGETRGCLGCGAGWADWIICSQDGLKQQLQASVPSDSVPSLQNMALLLDKLAKENQDIRLLQAQLQVGTNRRGWARLAPPRPGVCPRVLPQKKFPLFTHTP